MTPLLFHQEKWTSTTVGGQCPKRFWAIFSPILPGVEVETLANSYCTSLQAVALPVQV